MSRDCYVWVLELAIFRATSNEVDYWEPWGAFTSRSEAVEARNRNSKSVKWRIRKYVPAESDSKGKGPDAR